MRSCPKPDCAGTIGSDDYCEQCGSLSREPGKGSPPSGSTPSGSAPSIQSSSAGSTPSSTSASRRSAVSLASARYNRLPPPPADPDAEPVQALLTNPHVPEHKRFCAEPSCLEPVGRSRNGQPGLVQGFCPQCRTKFDFGPPLTPGMLVGGKYAVRGAIGHGGLGWVYLAWDTDVPRWVVLKGLMDPQDPDKRRAAVAELEALAKASHPNIVNVYNRVQHRHTGIAGNTPLDVDYIVMQYLTGPTLKDVFAEHQARDEYLPVAQVCRYALQVLQALGHLHDRDLLYCDFSPDNVIHTADGVRLIDLGAVRPMNDMDSPVFGKRGFQDPDIGIHGPSIGTDLYTVGRTMAVLAFPFPGFSTERQGTLPDPREVPLLARHDSFYRLLRRATDPDPGRRFASAEDMIDQVDAVLREILALDEARPFPAASNVFGPELRVLGADPDTFPSAALDARAVALALPDLQVDPTDPHAGLLASISASPGETLRALTSLADPSRETRLRAVLARIELDDPIAAGLDALDSEQPGDLRVAWLRGLGALAADKTKPAREQFTVVLEALPGEAAPKLALAVCAERTGAHAVAARYYETVWRTDHSYISAAWGLARARFALGDRAGMAEALESVPEHSSYGQFARLCAIVARERNRGQAEAPVAGFFEAAERLDPLHREFRELDRERRYRAIAEVLEATFGWVQAGKRWPKSRTEPVPETLLGHRLTERGLRAALEQTYRTLAANASTTAEAIKLVDIANYWRNGGWW